MRGLQSLSSRTALNFIVALGLAAPSFGPSAAVNQLRWAFVYVIAVAGIWVARRFDLSLTILLGYAALSLLWSPGGVMQVAHAAALYGVYHFGRYTRIDWRHGLVLAYTAVAIYQIFSPRMGWFGNENWNAEFLLIGAPLVLWWGASTLRLWIAILALVLAATALLLSNSNLHWMILVIWVWGVGLYLFTDNWKEAAAVTVLGALSAAVLVVGTVFETSFLYRFEIWFNALNMWLSAPVLGHGIGSFDYVYDSYREAHRVWGDFSVFGGDVARYAGAAHNLPVQILTELGLVGLLLVFACLRRFRWDAPSMAVAIGAALCLVGFPEQNPQTGLLLALALGASQRSSLTLPVLNSLAGIIWGRYTKAFSPIPYERSERTGKQSRPTPTI